MRRAISCVYCAPKSRIKILSAWMSALWMSVIVSFVSYKRRRETWRLPSVVASPRPVIRRLLRDLHVVHVALARPCIGDAHEARLPAHLLDRGATQVTHRRAQATRQLVHDAGERAAIRDATFDAFGHELVGVACVLEIAVLRPLLH